MQQKQPWTTWLVCLIAVSATVIGMYNLEWFLNVNCFINTKPEFSRHCKN